MDSVITVSEVVAWYRQWKWNLNMWVTRVKKRALPHSVIEWGWGGGSDGHRFHPCGLRCYFGCSAGWVVQGREGEVPPSSFTAFMKFCPEAAWGNTAAISSDYSYLQVTENKKPSQSVLYKCLSFLTLFSHKIGNIKVGWNLFSTADHSTTRHLVSVTPSLMCQFSSSSLTFCNYKMAINLSFPTWGRREWEESMLIAFSLSLSLSLYIYIYIYIYLLSLKYFTEKLRRLLLMCHWSKLCHIAILWCKGAGEDYS